jgi:thiamine-phosphate pyrophosphorylase
LIDHACRLYLITPNGLGSPGALVPFAEHLKAALGAGDVACLQLRIKGADDDLVRRAAETLMPIAHEFGVAFLINDRPDLAAALGADGAHIGQDDMPYEKARALLGPGRMIGVTAHASRHLGLEAAEAGADYVAFGAFFPTRTKEAKARANLELLTWWSELIEVPCVAIGGITPENARPLIEAGADFIAVSSGVWDHPQSPAAAVKAFNALF